MEDEIEKYIKTVRQACPKITQREVEYLKSGLSVEQFNTRHFYIQADTVQKNIGFVSKGLLRAFYIDKDGKDITIRFVSESEFATDYASLVKKTKSKYYFQCLEPTTIVNIPFASVQENCDEYPNLEKYKRIIADKAIVQLQNRIESFQFLSGEERYLDFVKHHPDLFNRVSLSLLSSYLGIERPSLSRIRKSIAQR